jgi:hypothetical protein
MNKVFRSPALARVIIAGAGILCFFAAPSRAESSYPIRSHGSALALPIVAGKEQPDLILAQRTIERRWGPSEDSTYREVPAPGWKSESGAMLMSAAVPGAGQVYSGERYGYLFLLGEAAGIYEVWELRRSSNRWESKARLYAGNPNDSTSNWSFESYEKRSGKSADDLRALYSSDPVLFYAEIANDDALNSGWTDAGSGDVTREQYSEWRENAETRRKRARYWSAGLWVNHIASAFDALRLARSVNLPIQRNIELHLKSGWHRGGPQFAAVIERRF